MERAMGGGRAQRAVNEIVQPTCEGASGNSSSDLVNRDNSKQSPKRMVSGLTEFIFLMKKQIEKRDSKIPFLFSQLCICMCSYI